VRPEYEARFSDIDPSAVRSALSEAGAELHLPRTLMRRVVFENDYITGRRGWLRLRDEGVRVTLTYKEAVRDGAVDALNEAEVAVADFDDTRTLLLATGFRAVRYQENYREEWRLGDVRYDIDTWPDLPTFLEIEGPSEDAVGRAARDLGFDLGTAGFGSVDELYLSALGRDILAEPQLLFPTT
jgi:adenylate cyclase, class 2